MDAAADTRMIDAANTDKPIRGSWKCFFLALALLIPLAYVGSPITVTIHEVLGHGLAAIMVGGEFVGFQVDFEGMGYALYSLHDSESVSSLLNDAPAWKHLFALFAGVTVTTILGAALLVTGYAFSRRPLISLPLLILSFNLLLDGLPYAFWNSLFPTGCGDFASIIAITESQTLRFGLIAVSGALTIAFTWLLTALIFLIIERWISPTGRLKGALRIAVLFMLGSFPAALWLTDGAWTVLAPGSGWWPSITAAVLHILCALSLYWIKFKSQPIRFSTRATVAAIAACWIISGAIVLVIALWLEPGVYWSWGEVWKEYYSG